MPPTFTDEGIRVAVELRDTNPEIGVVVLSQYAEPGLRQGPARRRQRAPGLPAQGAGQRSAAARSTRFARSRPAAASSIRRRRPARVVVCAHARAPRSGTLSERERQVLEQVAQGRSNAAVGAALALSERAVEKHINTLFTQARAARDAGRQPPGHGRAHAAVRPLGGSRKLAPLPDPPTRRSTLPSCRTYSSSTTRRRSVTRRAP